MSEVGSYVEIGERLASVRRHFGLTQTEMGTHLGVQQAAISQCETGRRLLGSRSLLKLSEMGVDVTWVLSGDAE